MRNSLLAMLMASAFMSFDARADDLLQIYQQALTNDPVYASAHATMVAGEEKVPQGRSGLLPNASISGSYFKNNLEEIPANPATATASDPALAGQTRFNAHYPESTYTIQLAQPLFRMANWEQYQIGILSAATTEAQFAQARQDLMLRVAQAYFDVLTSQDALASIQSNKVAITEQLASAKRNFEVGTTTITDTNEAQSRYDLAVAQELAAQNDLEIKRTALEQIIGKAPGELATLRTGVKLTLPEPAQMDKWVDSAEHENFSVVGQRLNVRSWRTVERSGLFWLHGEQQGEGIAGTGRQGAAGSGKCAAHCGAGGAAGLPWRQQWPGSGDCL